MQWRRIEPGAYHAMTINISVRIDRDGNGWAWNAQDDRGGMCGGIAATLRDAKDKGEHAVSHLNARHAKKARA